MARRLGALSLLSAAVATLGTAFLAFAASPRSDSPAAAALTEVGAPDAAPRLMPVIVHNDSEEALRVLIDGQIRLPRLPVEATVTLVLAEGSHELQTAAAAATPATTPLRPATLVEVRSRATTVSLTTTGVVASYGAAVRPLTMPALVAPVRTGVRLAVLISQAVALVLGFAAVTLLTIAQVVMARAKVVEERTRLRMDQAALRSLNEMTPAHLARAAQYR